MADYDDGIRDPFHETGEIAEMGLLETWSKLAFEADSPTTALSKEEKRWLREASYEEARDKLITGIQKLQNPYALTTALLKGFDFIMYNLISAERKKAGLPPLP